MFLEQKIILAAIEEMKIHALKFTMDDLTKRLRMSKTSLYKSVESKDKLLDAIILYVIDEFNRNELQIIEKDIPVNKKIIAFIQLYLEIFNSLGNIVYEDLRMMYEDKWKQWVEFQNEKIEMLMSLLKEGIEKEEFRKVNLAVVRQCLLVSSVNLTDVRFLRENNLNYSSVIETLFDVIFNGIKCV